MNLETSILIQRPPDRVWAYLGDVSKVAEWDRGVARTEHASGDMPGVGFEFDTLARFRGNGKDDSWDKMSYRITETDPVRGCTVQLTSTTGTARYFKSARWHFRVEPEAGGSRVFCAAIFQLRWRYMILTPVFFVMKRAIQDDLGNLKRALEHEGA